MKKHETPTPRVGGVLGGGAGLATGLVVALFPAAAMAHGLVAATTGSGALCPGRWRRRAGGMHRNDLKELGESLDAGQAGLIVVGACDMDTKIQAAMKRAEKTGTQGAARPTSPRSRATRPPS